MNKSPRHVHLVGATGRLRTATYDGRDHFAVPVVALMAGVFRTANARAPEYVPLDTLKTAPAGWNGRPVTLGHPMRGNEFVSANTPAVLAAQSLGQIFNARIEGTRLVMDAYLDPVKVARVGATGLLERLAAGETLEISVGCHVVTDTSSGVFDGHAYQGVWKEIVPDHVAFLSDRIGACSNAHGCGVRAAVLATAQSEPPNPYAPVWNNRAVPDDSAALQQMRENREAYRDFARGAHPKPATSAVYLNPPNPYSEAALAAWRRDQE